MQDLFIEFLPPWVETGLQPAFYDRESGTVLQQTARMYAKVNELVKAVNGMDKVIKEYVDYIDNYFKNLDVQEEINNKLDDMAEGGELAEFIALYANLPCVHAYATISDMASSENLEDGSYARAMSKTVAGTGDGFYYYIRAKTGADTPDGENLVAIGDDLVAVKIPDYALNALATAVDARCDAIEEDVAELAMLKNRKFIFVGDSYGTGQNELQEQTTPWTTLVPQYLGLTVGTNCWTDSHNGSGFNNGYTFISQLHDLEDAVPDPNEITDIVIIGGYNDRYYEADVIDGKMSECFAYAKTAFPNAQIMLACVGWSKVYSVRQEIANRVIRAYQKCGKYGVRYLKNTEFILHDYSLFSGDHYHPNQNGQNELSTYLADAILTGSCTIDRWKTDVLQKIEETDTLNPSYSIQIQHNDRIDLVFNIGYMVRSTATDLGSGTTVALFTLNPNGYIMGPGIDVFPEYAEAYVATAGGTGMAEVRGNISVVYDATNHRAVVYFITDKRQTSNEDISAYNMNTVHISMPALFC